MDASEVYEGVGYVRWVCKGGCTPEEFLHFIKTALQYAANAGHFASLIDITELTAETPDTMARFFLGKGLATFQLAQEPPILLAVVGREPLIENERFGEKVANNRGATARVFTTLVEAHKWLSQMGT